MWSVGLHTTALAKLTSSILPVLELSHPFLDGVYYTGTHCMTAKPIPLVHSSVGESIPACFC